jgi:hypothetical protein
VSLSDELAAEVDPRRHCGVCNWIAQQAEEDQAIIEAWLNEGKPQTQLHRACVRSGLRIQYARFNQHVNECR